MATVANAVDVIAEELHVPRGRVHQLARRLKEVGALPVGRGRFVPKIEPGHVVSLIISTCTDSGMANASASTESYGALRYGGLRRGGLDPDNYPEPVKYNFYTAFDYLTVLFEKFAFEDGEAVRGYANCQIAFSKNWHEITVSFDGKRECSFIEAGALADHWQNPAIHHCTTISGIAFGNIARRLFGGK
tara:strand:+ start:11491 stop:12057 length:567 start_codon:yes stop_codon:yes gene_type:complete